MKDNFEQFVEKLKEIEYLIMAGRYRKAKELTQELRKELEQ